MIIRKRMIVLLTSGVFALGALSACGGAATADGPQGSPIAKTETTTQQASTGSLPLYPDAKPLDPSNPMAAAADAMKQQMAKQQGNARVDIYELPGGTKFEQVKSFYGDALSKQGYSEFNTGQQAQLPQGAGMAVWTDSSSKAVSVMVVDNPMGGAMLIVGQGTK